MYINDCHKRCLGRFLGRFSFQNFEDNPLLGPSSVTLQKMGALDKRKVVDDHQGWRLITSMWLHGGVFHLLVNMVGLLVIGIRLELEFGFVRIGMLYLISGFGGAILSSLFLQISISVGASGAVFGLLGAMLSELIINWTIYDNELAWFITFVGIIIVNLALGVLPHVDNFDHIGGFITGFLLGFVFLIRPQFKWITQRHAPAEYSSAHARPKYKTYQCILWVVSLILLVVGIVIGMVSLLRGFDANKYCYWCHYLTCVPTPSWKCGNLHIFCSFNQNHDQLNITCSSNGKSAIYLLPDATILQLDRLCSVVCD
ncbi:RHOMBOID-like protein 1 [Tripterygium wilfordii]|uniref:RHOMBOID-like protein 1 n=1 Tax=Tripterygium wilfordii TaxID=458696 RepID=UPI0018F8497D|nr:RHOMBOID-like protein 1 [Tripterygium wilfordii]